MPLDAIFLTAALRELRPDIIGARAEKIRQPERDEIIIALRGERRQSLLISAGAADARVHFTEADYENPAAPPMFCMLLRKHLSGAKIIDVTQPRGERVVIFTFSGLSVIGEPEEKKLIAELMGRGSNIILTDAEGIIIDCLRRVDAETAPRRPVLPGLIYRPPLPQEKQDPTRLDASDWERAVDSAPPDTRVEKWLNTAFSALSPLICRELAYRAYGDTDITTTDARARDGGAALAARAAELIGFARENDEDSADISRQILTPEPYILLDEHGEARDFSYTELRQYGAALKSERVSGFSELLERYFTTRAADERMRARASALTRTIKNARDRALRRVSAQREELSAAAGRERLRECGDLIMANLHNVKKGDEMLAAEDLFAENGGVRSIALDPRKTPQANAARYYKDYAKAKNAEKILSERIALGEREAEYLESVLAEISISSGESELNEIRAELTETGYLKPEKNKTKRKVKPTAPRRYISSAGSEILVGRGNTQNDELTFKTAFKTDVWLHVKARHGSHVILRTGGRAPDEADISEAASLAAYFSEARGETRAVVDWCLARYVKKTPGAKPGMVIYTDYKTVAVQPGEI
ncbi:MAG: NFACT family protein [Oscillospiraceae bacterium]|jgi:predicted ribosome quality control (RQC) complex YloA/Tae2 family protein|nr:NFACT family protein [Oscillospiraceae bacterium]